MKQERIKDLLQEAALSYCPGQRRISILAELSREVTCPELELMLDGLFLQTINNKPFLLSALLPAFIMICGDREPDMELATVDWSEIR